MADPARRLNDHRLRRAARCSAGLFALFCAACQPSGSSLNAAEEALEKANRLDSQLEAAPDPAAVETARDASLAEARERFEEVLEQQPELPEALLGLATVSWRADGDAVSASQWVKQVIGQLEPLRPDELTVPRPSGKTAGQLLARAYAERASYLLSTYLEPDPTGPPAAAPPMIPPGPLAQATTDLDRALILDPQPQYQFLRDQVEHLDRPATPMDAAELAAVEAVP